MQTKDVLALESASEGDIILHKEGIFWRAYQYSAFLFSKHIRPLKVITKFVKVVDTEIAYLGFPEKVLEEVLKKAVEKNWKVEKEEKQIIIVLGADVSPEAFQSWIADHRERREKLNESSALDDGDDKLEKVIRKLQSYPILEKSPLETQQFVLNLQKEINGLI